MPVKVKNENSVCLSKNPIKTEKNMCSLHSFHIYTD